MIHQQPPVLKSQGPLLLRINTNLPTARKVLCGSTALVDTTDCLSVTLAFSKVPLVCSSFGERPLDTQLGVGL